MAFSPSLNREFTDWDGRIRLRWKGIKVPPFIGKNEVEERANAVWLLPRLDWFKLNFDGASRGNLGPSGIGCVIRDHEGLFIGKVALPIPPDTNNIAEFKAIMIGLTECSRRSVKNIEIERDSSLVINAVRVRKTPNWRLQAILDKVLQLLSGFQNFSCSHIYREANSELDLLSKSAAEGDSLSWWAHGFDIEQREQA
ncbi:uncharacterized protein LOC131068972 [Cryptomeria japonica]|uniref:uncharacterized protein LOC131068972 n=1 Tax=Cryptomeria japonica TaxID=3369 RepID=UPI0025AD2E01|nr:uncharacterized protein LOC131068972 [Cryptomeria japonica]